MKHAHNNPATNFAMLLMALAMSLAFLACEEKGKKADADPGGSESLAHQAEAETPKAEEASEPAIFKTVKIGEQTWMAENLNVETANSWCYDNDKSNCDKYGRLYTWEAAKKACPSGWHLPSHNEWFNLMEAVGGEHYWNDEENYHRDAGKKLKSKTGWDGTDNYEFSALPSGRRDTDGSFSFVGSFGVWWKSDVPCFMSMDSGDDNASHSDESNKSYGYSVRCVKD